MTRAKPVAKVGIVSILASKGDDPYYRWCDRFGESIDDRCAHTAAGICDQQRGLGVVALLEAGLSFGHAVDLTAGRQPLNAEARALAVELMGTGVTPDAALAVAEAAMTLGTRALASP